MTSNIQIEQVREKAASGHAGSQFLLSQICLQNRDLDSMMQWLEKAARSDLPDAVDALGHCFEKGLGIEVNYEAALAHYDRAVQLGCNHAAFRRAELIYKSQQGPSRENEIRRSLEIAATGRVVVALRVIGYLAIQRESSRSFGLNCLKVAAQSGDAVSAFNLAWSLMRGWGGQAAINEAGYWAQQAASDGYPYANMLLAACPAPAVVPASPLVASTIDFGAPFALYPEDRETDAEIVCDAPPITMFHNVLNDIDCAYLIFVSGPRLTRANVIDPGSEMDGMVSSIRTSMSTYLPFHWVDIISRYVELKIMQQTGEELLLSEPMSILRYAPGEYYRPHVDYFNPELNVSEGLMEDGGQRTASAVTYLSTPAAGGGTSFPKLGIKLPAAAGSTLWFRNCDDNGEIDTRSLHAGDTVGAGEKWVVTKWFRQCPTHYTEF